MSKTTSLLKHMTEETNLYKHERYSWMTVVALGQNVKTPPPPTHTLCKFLLILKMGVPVFIGVSWTRLPITLMRNRY